MTLRAMGAWIALGLLISTFPALPTLADKSLGPSDDSGLGGDAHARLCEAIPQGTTWATDPASGLRYRQATASERAANGWAGLAWLVEQGSLAGVPEGAPQVDLLVPQCVGAPLHFGVDLARSAPGVPHVLFPLDGEPQMWTPLSFFYHTPGLSDVEARRILTEAPTAMNGAALLGTQEGGFVGSVVIDCVFRVSILAPERTWRIDAGGIAGESLVLIKVRKVVDIGDCGGGNPPTPECSDGSDNDGDGWTDYPNDPGCSSSQDTSEVDTPVRYDYITAGEVKFCTTFQANWGALMDTQAIAVHEGFGANGGTRAEPIHQLNACWLANSIDDANFCANTGGCKDAEGHDYTYNGCQASSTCYRDRGWPDVAHLRLHFNFGAMRLVQVIHNGAFDDACGRAAFPGDPAEGASTVHGWNTGGSCESQHTATHEMGHNFRGIHGDAVQDAAGCWTVMVGTWEPCVHNWFSDKNRKRVNYCVDTLGADCPRNGSG